MAKKYIDRRSVFRLWTASAIPPKGQKSVLRASAPRKIDRLKIEKNNTSITSNLDNNLILSNP